MVQNPQTGRDMTATEELEYARQEQLVKEAPYYTCVCGGLNFIQILRYKKVSGLLDGSGVDKKIGIPAVACVECGEIPPEYLKKMEVIDEPKQSTIIT